MQLKQTIKKGFKAVLWFVGFVLMTALHFGIFSYLMYLDIDYSILYMALTSLFGFWLISGAVSGLLLRGLGWIRLKLKPAANTA